MFNGSIRVGKEEEEEEGQEAEYEEEKDEDVITALSAMQAVSQGYSFELFVEDWAGYLAKRAARGAADVLTDTDIGTCRGTDTGTREQCLQFLRDMQ